MVQTPALFLLPAVGITLQRNIEDTFCKTLSRSDLDKAKELYIAASRAYTVPEFEAHMNALYNLSPAVWDYVCKIDPKHWAIAFAAFFSFGILTTNGAGWLLACASYRVAATSCVPSTADTVLWLWLCILQKNFAPYLPTTKWINPLCTLSYSS